MTCQHVGTDNAVVNMKTKVGVAVVACIQRWGEFEYASYNLRRRNYLTNTDSNIIQSQRTIYWQAYNFNRLEFPTGNAREIEIILAKRIRFIFLTKHQPAAWRSDKH